MKFLKYALGLLLLTHHSHSFSMTRNGFFQKTGYLLTGAMLANDSDQSEETAELAENTQHNKEETEGYPLTIMFYGPVTLETCVKLTSYLKELDYKSKQMQLKYGHVFPIKLHMQSGGGMLMPTFYVCDLMNNLDTPIHVYIDGYVASAASLIAICGKKRFMTKHSFMLIHQLQSQSAGKLNEMTDEIANLNFFMKNAKDIYYKNYNISEETLNNLLSNELWIDAETSIKYGLIDEII